MFREHYQVFKKPSKVKLRVCVCFPESYRLASATLAVHLLYYLFNSFEGVYAERCFFSELPSRGVSLETKTPLKDFDVILFSLHYELDFPKAVRMLIDGGIPPLRRERGGGYPLLIAGGPAVTQNPLPLSEIFDSLFIGEVEPVAEEMVNVFMEIPPKEDKVGALEGLRKLGGFYVPLFSNKARRVWARNLDESYYPVLQFYSPDEEPIFGRSFLLEINRGCGWGCRFCLAGYIYRPPRFRSFSKVLEITERASELIKTHQKVTIIAFAGQDHPKFKDIISYLVREQKVEVSVPSLRVDRLDMDALTLLREGGQRVLTIAPEVAAEHLAIRINKCIFEENVVEVSQVARKAGFNILKMYFMIGLPFEDIKDIEKIADLVKKVRKIGFTEVRLSVTPFIPKPNTPMQWFGQENFQELRRKVNCLMRKMPRGVRVNIFNLKKARIEAIIARGGIELAQVFLRVAVDGKFTVSSWHKAFRESGISLSLSEKEYDREEELPWQAVVDTGVSEAFLKKEYEKYVNCEASRSCYKGCSACGVCF